ncbi:AAA family ATPase [Candidatus Woesearchaeota archaeon]|nr:AAA family ATPase [Candidatus Woesearchaeota archaeon]
MVIICVSGSVGSGKSTLSKKLAKSLKFEYFDVTKEIKKNKLSSGYDEEKKCEIVDEKKLIKFLVEKINNSENLVIDSIFAHLIPKKYIDLCIVTTCDIGILRDRLKKRKYSSEKVRENVEVEIFDSFVIEAKEKKHNLLILDTSEGYKLKEIVEFVKKQVL